MSIVSNSTGKQSNAIAFPSSLSSSSSSSTSERASKEFNRFPRADDSPSFPLSRSTYPSSGTSFTSSGSSFGFTSSASVSSPAPFSQQLPPRNEAHSVTAPSHFTTRLPNMIVNSTSVTSVSLRQGGSVQHSGYAAVSTSRGSTRFTCHWDRCGQTFSTRTGLATHASSHLDEFFVPTGEKRFKQVCKCKWEGCDRELSDVKALAKHLSHSSHLGQAPFVKRMEGSDSSEHSNEDLRHKKRFPCKVPGCDKSFTDSSNRKKHEKTHDANRERFYCKEPGCTKSYSTRTDLNIHSKAHLGVFPHACSRPGCKKAFIRLSELYAHERIHDNILPHVCIFCNKRFREKARLKKHESAHEHEHARDLMLLEEKCAGDVLAGRMPFKIAAL